MERKGEEDSKKSSNHIDVLQEVKQLLKEGANANIRNKDGFTVLQLAVRNRHPECLETLIRDGNAKLDQRGPYVKHPLSLAASLIRISSPSLTGAVRQPCMNLACWASTASIRYELCSGEFFCLD